MHVSAEMCESHAELIESDQSFGLGMKLVTLW